MEISFRLNREERARQAMLVSQALRVIGIPRHLSVPVVVAFPLIAFGLLGVMDGFSDRIAIEVAVFTAGLVTLSVFPRTLIWLGNFTGGTHGGGAENVLSLVPERTTTLSFSNDAFVRARPDPIWPWSIRSRPATSSKQWAAVRFAVFSDDDLYADGLGLVPARAFESPSAFRALVAIARAGIPATSQHESDEPSLQPWSRRKLFVHGLKMQAAGAAILLPAVALIVLIAHWRNA